MDRPTICQTTPCQTRLSAFCCFGRELRDAALALLGRPMFLVMDASTALVDRTCLVADIVQVADVYDGMPLNHPRVSEPRGLGPSGRG